MGNFVPFCCPGMQNALKNLAVDDTSLSGRLGRLRSLVDAKTVEFVSARDGAGNVRHWSTSKAPISVVFHSFRLIFGRVIISRNGFEAWTFFSGTRARGTAKLKRR